MALNRRAFLTRVAGAAAAVAAAPLLPAAAVAPPPLLFHPDAFAMTMGGLPLVGETIRVPFPQRFERPLRGHGAGQVLPHR